MKKLFIVVLTALFCHCYSEAQIEPTDTDSNGYRNVSSLEHLKWINENYDSWSDKFELDNDIDASDTKNWNNGKGWCPLGDSEKNLGNRQHPPFKGEFLGNGYKISNIYINRPSGYNIGFFGCIEEACISKLNIVDAEIYGKNSVAGFCGFNYHAVISDCSVSGYIFGLRDIAGFCSDNFDSNIINCFSNCELETKGVSCGGFLSINIGGEVISCYSKGSLTFQYNESITYNGYDNYTGFCGSNREGLILACYSHCNVFGYNDVAGFCGENTGNIIQCLSTGEVNSVEAKFGFCADNKSEIHHSYWDISNSGLTDSDGGEGKYTSDLKNISTYEKWDFKSVWEINNDYPELKPILYDYSGSGHGTENDPYIISDIEDLQNVIFEPIAYYVLSNDIDAAETLSWNNGNGFFPIWYGFRCFNGNEKVINNLYINRPEYSKIGLFGRVYLSEVKNISLYESNISGYDEIGGLAGICRQSSIINCHVSGTVEGNDYVGGLLGTIIVQSSVKFCYSNIDIQSSKYFAGGFCGKNSSNSDIEFCYSQSVINGFWAVGGFCGENREATIKNCFSQGKVNGSEAVGGFVGNNRDDLEIINCYSTCEADAKSYEGGFIGRNAGYPVISCYWDTQTSGITESDGGTGKTTAEMMMQATFVDWDFDDTWCIVEGKTYPQLQHFVDCDTLVSVPQRGLNSDLLIYPNPTENILNISFDSNNSLFANIQIFNQLGQIVFSDPSADITQPYKVNTSIFPPGIYYLKVSASGISEVRSFVVYR